LTVKAYLDRVCIYFDGELIARHARSYSRYQDIEDQEHAKGLIAKRSRAREQRLMLRFLALSPDAQAYYDGLEQKRLNARHHLRKILALAEIYPADSIARAIADGLAFHAQRRVHRQHLGDACPHAPRARSLTAHPRSRSAGHRHPSARPQCL
jgi:hypothetical protein